MIAAFLLALLLHAPVAPVPPAAPAAAAPSPEAVAAALALFEGKDIEKQLTETTSRIMDASLQAQLRALQAQGTAVPPSFVLRLRELMADEGKALVAAMTPTFRSEAAAVYARHFTAAELRELKRLQAHPVMKKAERLGPVMVVELSEIGRRAAAARMPALKAKVDRMVRDWQRDQKIIAPSPST